MRASDLREGGGRSGLHPLFVFGLAAALIGAPVRSASFPEEDERAQWDKGCSDWPENSEPLAIRIEKSQGDLRVGTRLVMYPEPGESIVQLMDRANQLLAQPERYADWVMPGINEKSTGGRYFVNVDKLTPGSNPELGQSHIAGRYTLKVLWFEREGATTLLFRDLGRKSLPSCPAFKGATFVGGAAPHAYFYRMIPRPDVLTRLAAETHLVAFENRVELWLRLVATPARLLYELLPETLVRTELEMRGRRLWDNFLDVRRLEALKAESSVPSSRSRAP